MRTPKRIWRTGATNGPLVLDGHPDAAFLVYGEGDDVLPSHEAEVKALIADKAKAEPKSAPKADNKSVSKPDADK